MKQYSFLTEKSNIKDFIKKLFKKKPKRFMPTKAQVEANPKDWNRYLTGNW